MGEKTGTSVNPPAKWVRVGLIIIPETLKFLGPILAGFQAAAAFVGYIGLGEFARWVLDHWLPFTRWLWTWVLTNINLPDVPLNDSEKDALTTFVFFVPMLIWALLSSKDESQQSKFDGFRIPAMISALIFILILGHTSAVAIYSTFTIIGDIGNQPHWVKGTYSIAVLFLSINILRTEFKKDTYDKAGEPELPASDIDSENTNSSVVLSAFKIASAIAGLAGLFSSVFSLLQNFRLVGRDFASLPIIGSIEFSSLIGALLVSIFVARRTPDRMLYAVGSALFFISASIGWEVYLFLKNLIEQSSV